MSWTLLSVRLIAPLVALAVGLTLTACSRESTDGNHSTAKAKAKAKADAALVIAEGVVPQTFDPTQSSQIKTWYVWQFVYEGLVRPDASSKIDPVLASSWTVNPQQAVYEFTLRDGVPFSDGTPMLADDVVFSFERLNAKGLPYAKDRFKFLAAATKVDDHRGLGHAPQDDSELLYADEVRRLLGQGSADAQGRLGA